LVEPLDFAPGLVFDCQIETLIFIEFWIKLISLFHVLSFTLITFYCLLNWSILNLLWSRSTAIIISTQIPNMIQRRSNRCLLVYNRQMNSLLLFNIFKNILFAHACKW
jgi:hypothetical protein